MSWLRRLSRDRSSKHEQDLDNNVDHRAATYRPGTSSGQQQQQSQQQNISTAIGRRAVSASKNSEFPNEGDNNMLRNSAPAHYDNGAGPVFMPHGPSNGSGDLHSSPRGAGAVLRTGAVSDRKTIPNSASFEPIPDPLQRAFNEALKPYLEQISALKSDLESAHQTIASMSSENANLTQQQTLLHSWIDKRGLRPDLPPALSSTLPQSSVAASTLSTQLDRKMTMLNYSLHHLADSAPDSLPASTVTTTLSTLLPPIQHLATLPSGGPAFAFETLIKLAGNLNSHSTGEETDEDRQQIANFYDQIDESMSGVVGRRFQGRADGLEDWDVSKDIKRLEKTGAFLRKEMGVTNYFVHSIDLLKDGAVGGGAANMFAGGGGGGGGHNGQAGGAHAHMYDDHGGR